MPERVNAWKIAETKVFQQRLRQLGVGFAQLDLLKDLKGELGVLELLAGANASYGPGLEQERIIKFGEEAVKSDFYPAQDEPFSEYVQEGLRSLEDQGQVVAQDFRYTHPDYIPKPDHSST